MRHIKTVLMSAVMATACLAGAPALAKTWVFNFTDTNNDVASGQFTTLDVGPNYAITGIDGLFNGFSITGASPYAAADNTLYMSSSTPFSFSGISFDVSGRGSFNLFADGSLLGQVLDSASNPGGSAFAGNYAEIRSLSITAVPEPAAWGLMIVGIGGIGMMLRRAKRAQATIV